MYSYICNSHVLVCMYQSTGVALVFRFDCHGYVRCSFSEGQFHLRSSCYLSFICPVPMATPCVRTKHGLSHLVGCGWDRFVRSQHEVGCISACHSCRWSASCDILYTSARSAGRRTEAGGRAEGYRRRSVACSYEVTSIFHPFSK